MECARIMEFDAGHRVLGHGGRCKHLHGHRYKIELVCTTLGLNELGMVVDFGVIKQVVGKWIDDKLDHNMILHPEDPLLNALSSKDGLDDVFGGLHPFIMPNGNPTAENIAQMLFDQAVVLLRHNGEDLLDVKRVVVWETPNCYAAYEGR